MENAFYTLQEYYTFTKGVTYVLIIMALAGFLWFWQFLTAGDDDEQA